MSVLAKRFGHKIYDGDGVYLTTLPRDLVVNTPGYTWAINSGMGEMSIVLALTLKQFVESYENTIIKFGNEVRTIVTDAAGHAMQIFDGYITQYAPSLDDDGHEQIVVRVTSTTKTLADALFKDGTATSKTYSSLDPSNIMKNVLDKYAGVIHYTGGSIETTGTTVTYTLKYLTYLEAVEVILGLCPAFWYWFVDADNLFHLKAADFDTVDHLLYIGKQVSAIQASKSVEELYNAVYFKGGGATPLYKLYERDASIDEYQRRDYKMQDERVTVEATASTMANKFLDEHDHPRSILTATVLDNSVDAAKGYDIESFRPGQVVQILHPRITIALTLWDVAEWDVDFWDFNIIYSLSLPMQIMEIQYQYDRAVLKLSLVRTDVAHRIEDIERNLDTVRAEDIPTTPS